MKKLVLLIGIVGSGMLIQAQKKLYPNGVHKWGLAYSWIDVQFDLPLRCDKIQSITLTEDTITIQHNEGPYIKCSIDYVISDGGIFSRIVEVKITERHNGYKNRNRLDAYKRVKLNPVFSKIYAPNSAIKATIKYTSNGDIEWIEFVVQVVQIYSRRESVERYVIADKFAPNKTKKRKVNW